MAGEKFYLIFSENPYKRNQINEPVGYSEVDFNLDQKEGGMGRDVSLSGGSVKFKFTLHRHGLMFEKLLYYAHIFGFEADVKLVIVLSDGTEFIGELDFVMAETNDFNYFDCPVIIESQMQIFKRRSETKVDLFSSVDINGNPIDPLVPLNMLLQAKPNIQNSEWTQPNTSNYFLSTKDDLYVLINPAQNLDKSEIADTFTFFSDSVNITTDDLQGSKANTFLALKANSNLKNIKINALFGVNYTTSTSSGGNGYTEYKFVIRYGGSVFQQAKEIIVIYSKNTENQTYSFNGAVPEIVIDQLNRGDGVWIAHFVRLRQSAGGISPLFRSDMRISDMKVSVKAESTNYNSITPTFRLIDVMKQIAKSTSGLEVYSPRYDLGGQFYDNVVTSGKLLGGNITDPFYVSWDDIFDKSIAPEHLADSEIQLDQRVFCGIEKDFYTGEECAFFNNTQFSSMVRKPNPMYCINNFNFKYDNYQSLKENTEPNSESTIHGQSIFTPYNQRVENSRELSIKWIRDAILWDVQQRLSTKVSEDTATQDDDKIFVIDTLATENDQQFTESTNLQHTYNGTYLSLRSNGEVNFIVLGIKVGTTFVIEYPDLNAGNYLVYSVSNTELQLTRTSGGAISPTNDGIRVTKYTYEIKQETIPLTNRTNQGFNVVLNIISPERYSNLRYSVERNIRNYHNNYLATVNMYHADKPIKNTYYKNNGKCETEFAGLRVIEKEDWIPTDPIVTPYMYENVIFANVDFSRFIELQTQIRSKRGFIRTIDNNKRVLKLYPIKMSYENRTRQLTISGQEKFEKAYLTIVKANGLITVNDETRLRNIIYDPVVLERDKKVLLLDLERQQLYNGVFWNKCEVNGQIAQNIEELKSWLDLL